MEMNDRSPTRRLENWPALLRRFLEDRKRTPFAWGTNDCGLFAADAARAMTGVDPAAGLRGYKSKRGAQTRLGLPGADGRARGVTGLAQDMADLQGWPAIDPAYAGRGDIVAVITRLGPTLAVVDLNGHTCWAPGPAGLVACDMATATHAWRIG